MHSFQANLETDFLGLVDIDYNAINQVIEKLESLIFRSQYMPELTNFKQLEETGYSISFILHHLRYFEEIRNTVRMAFIESLHAEFWKMVHYHYDIYNFGLKQNR